MYYIVFDMEFNHNDTKEENGSKQQKLFFEIIQIGAYKLDEHLNILSTFNRFIRPSIYESIDPRITEMTTITTHQLQKEAIFPEVYKDFIEYTGDTDSVFCTWGISDMKVLFRNAKHFQLDTDQLPKHFINLQPYVSLHLNQSKKKLLGLEAATIVLDIPVKDAFHNALNDAYYTTMIFKKMHTPYMLPQKYDPIYTKERPRHKRRVIDFDSLIKQFEKMYSREMSKEEIEIIKLAYKMGHTNQFIKQEEASSHKMAELPSD